MSPILAPTADLGAAAAETLADANSGFRREDLPGMARYFLPRGSMASQSPVLHETAAPTGSRELDR